MELFRILKKWSEKSQKGLENSKSKSKVVQLRQTHGQSCHVKYANTCRYVNKFFAIVCFKPKITEQKQQSWLNKINISFEKLHC